jgi:TPR repeat protein
MWLVILVVGVVCLAGVGGFLTFRNSGTVPVSSASKPPIQPADVVALKTKVDSGDAQAQADLAHLYVTGEGVTNSYDQAAILYRKSAEQGNASGEAGLAELCEAGRGVKKDMTEAFKWYRSAAAHGSAAAQYALGFHYEAGSGVAQDQAEATKWYRLAAEQGDPLAQYDLGQRYDIGVGVAADPVEGLKWILLAAAQGQADSIKRAATMKDKMSRDQVAEAKRRADAFVPKSRQKS